MYFVRQPRTHQPFIVCAKLRRLTGPFAIPRMIQGGEEPTDTFQMVIDNVWKQGKICETVHKYVQVCYLLPTDYKLIF